MRDWGALDVAAAIDCLAARFPGQPLHLLGHSAGGWLAGIAGNADKLGSFATVASQSGNWRPLPCPERAVAAPFWVALLPPSDPAPVCTPARVLCQWWPSL